MNHFWRLRHTIHSDYRFSMIDASVAEVDGTDTVDGSSLTSWDTAEQSVISRSEVTTSQRVDLSVRGDCLERLPLCVDPSPSPQGHLPLMIGNPAPLPPPHVPSAVNPLDQSNKQVWSDTNKSVNRTVLPRV